MEENKQIKIKLETIIYIFIIILLIIALGIIYYLGFIKNKEEIAKLQNEEIELKEKIQKLEKANSIDKEDNINQGQIPTSDLVTLNYEATNKGIRLFYGYIEDGYLYYYIDEKGEMLEVDDIVDFDATFCKGPEMLKYEEVNNIKRIKEFSGGPSITRTVFLITEDGKVYKANIYDEQFQVIICEELKEYKVEDILRYNTEKEWFYKILLKDGTTKIVTSKE
ncbi:MAG: hypothetical protein ACI4UX_05470 [Clostridia bacterium]